jgi:parvulin-like peptidyl-prolyl isomerase
MPRGPNSGEFSYVVAVAVIVLAILVRAAWAQPQQSAAAGGDLNREAAALVDGKPIYVRTVERELDRALGGREVEPGARKVLQAKTLEQLIGRRLVLAYLHQRKLGASDSDLDLALERIKSQLKQRNLTLADYLARAGMDEAEFRDTLAWQVAWQRYLNHYLTDQNLQKYFETHRAEFDGTQVKVAHILLKIEPQNDSQALRAALARAEQIRDEIAGGKLTFATAAQKYSAAPTAVSGGELGFISRHEPMPEPFSKAAFALQKAEISPPVVSPFGVHLIQCLEIRPGQQTWQDARESLRSAVMAYLFDWLASQQRPMATIQFTAAVPHFKPGTQQLADGD